MSESPTLPAATEVAAQDLLRDSALFRGCTPDDLSDLARLGEAQCFVAGEDIIREGDEPRYVYLVQQGEVSVLKVSPVAGQHELVRLGAGAHFGELALLEMGARSATVRARTPVTVVAFPIASIVELWETRPHFARLVNGLSREVAARLRHSNDARIEALDRALEEERTRAALGRLLVSLIGVYSLYNFLFSTATTVKAVLGHTEFASIPIIAFMTAIQVQFMRRSGYPARAFGLTLDHAGMPRRPRCSRCLSSRVWSRRRPPWWRGSPRCTACRSSRSWPPARASIPGSRWATWPSCRSRS
ncbi:MAG: hypothetical protein DMF78_11550 [Acidobacteria bacterium]|nr:MAG: hypothetical protein DMF78_11550 [Acidobacteriota bacterium]